MIQVASLKSKVLEWKALMEKAWLILCLFVFHGLGAAFDD